MAYNLHLEHLTRIIYPGNQDGFGRGVEMAMVKRQRKDLVGHRVSQMSEQDEIDLEYGDKEAGNDYNNMWNEMSECTEQALASEQEADTAASELDCLKEKLDITVTFWDTATAHRLGTSLEIVKESQIKTTKELIYVRIELGMARSKQKSSEAESVAAHAGLAKAEEEIRNLQVERNTWKEKEKELIQFDALKAELDTLKLNVLKERAANVANTASERVQADTSACQVEARTTINELRATNAALTGENRRLLVRIGHISHEQAAAILPADKVSNLVADQFVRSAAVEKERAWKARQEEHELVELRRKSRVSVDYSPSTPSVSSVSYGPERLPVASIRSEPEKSFPRMFSTASSLTMSPPTSSRFTSSSLATMTPPTSSLTSQLASTLVATGSSAYDESLLQNSPGSPFHFRPLADRTGGYINYQTDTATFDDSDPAEPNTSTLNPVAASGSPMSENPAVSRPDPILPTSAKPVPTPIAAASAEHLPLGVPVGSLDFRFLVSGSVENGVFATHVHRDTLDTIRRMIEPLRNRKKFWRPHPAVLRCVFHRVERRENSYRNAREGQNIGCKGCARFQTPCIVYGTDDIPTVMPLAPYIRAENASPASAGFFLVDPVALELE